MSETLKRKLTSRKLWAATAGFISGLLIFLGYPKETAVQVAALIMSGASVIAYCVGEGLADNGNGTIYIPDAKEIKDEQ